MPENANSELFDDREFTEDEYDLILSATEPLVPKATGLSRLMAAATFEERFERYAEPLSAILHVGVTQASELLAGVDNHLQWEPEPGLPGAQAVWVEGGPAVQGCIRGFVRLKAGHSFPEHGHLGPETTLILQGRLKLDDGRVFGPGDVYEAGPDATHSLQALEGPDLLYFVVVRKGIRIGDMEILHRDAQ